MYTTIFLFLLLLNCCDSLYRQSNIIFQSNGYSNVLLAIHDSVTDETILDKIKDAFTKASTTLHTATKKRAYFKEIVILVPNSWKDSPGITPAAAGQTLQYADIIVSAPLPTHRNFPYTRSYAACGHSGIHIQMLTDVFLHPSKPPVKLSP
ncbi:calcium-activated chloride channel regulator 1, partial [Mytilus galloprovincialis]